MIKSHSLAEFHPKRWINQLDFLQDEIKYLQNQLAEVTSTDPQHEVMAVAHKFKQDFYTKLREIDKLRFKAQTFAANPMIAEDVEMLVRNFQRLKSCFRDFISDHKF